MWEQIRKVDFGIKFAVLMLGYLSVSQLLARWFSMALAQGLAIPIIVLVSYPLLAKEKGQFGKTALLSLLLGSIVWLVLRIFLH